MATDESSSHVRPRQILIVDDNADAADMLAMNLRAAGHSATIAADGTEALTCARDSVPEVVILDIGMAGLNGYDVARTLRQGSATKGALLIAVTGWAGEANRQRAMEAGFDHHLTKPVKMTELLSLIEDDKKHA